MTKQVGFRLMRALAAVLAFAACLKGQTRVPGLRLYVLDCGTLIYNFPESYNLTRQEVANTNMSVACYLIVHPKGTLVFDTGLGDRYVGRPFNLTPLGDSPRPTAVSYFNLVTTTLKSQMDELGYPERGIDFLAVSHSHADHTGNVGDFANATWLLRKPDYDSIFGGTATRPPAFAPMRQDKAKVIDGDFDVFGDGTVVLLSTPGHTPSHQSLYVKLAHTGGIVLSGDLYHYPEERTLNRMPDSEKNKETAASRTRVESFVRERGAQLWIGHDVSLFSRQNHAPKFYD